MRLKIISIVGIICFAFSSWAYDHVKCMNMTRNWFAPMNLFLSTSSFTTSTGGCAAIGSIEHRKEYFAYNFESIRVDVAKGQGEFLANYLALSKCSPDAEKSIISTLQSQYTSIYESGPQNDPKSSFWALEKILRETSEGQCIIST